MTTLRLGALSVVAIAVLFLAPARVGAQSRSAVEFGAGFGYMAPRGPNFPSVLTAASFWLTPKIGIAASLNIAPGDTPGPSSPPGGIRLLAIQNRTHGRVTVRTRLPLSTGSSVAFGVGLFSGYDRRSYARPVTPSETLFYKSSRDWSGFSFEALGDVALKGAVAIQFGLVLDVSERSYPMPFALLKVGL